MSLSRDDRAVAFLKKLASEGRDHDAKAARTALEIYPDSGAISG
jgi:hypothetical protein